MEPVDHLGNPSAVASTETPRSAPPARAHRRWWQPLKNRRPPQLMLWLATVAGSAIIGLVVNDWWSAPRPTFELSTVQLRPITTDESQQIVIPPETQNTIGQHMYLPALGEKPTVKSVREYIASAAELDAQHERALERLDKLIEVLRTTPPTMTQDNRRRRLLEVWFADQQGPIVATLVKLIAAQHEEQLPPDYKRPRSGAYPRWIELSPTFTISLGEIDEVEQARGESAVRGHVNVYDRVLRDAHKVNLLRRLWHHADPEVLQPILEASKAHLRGEIAKAKDVSRQLLASIDSAQPLHVVATVVVTNSGGRPIALRNVGVLRLRLPPVASSTEEVLPIDLTSASFDPITVIEADHVALMRLRSMRTAAQLVHENASLRGANGTDVQSSRLRALFEAGGIRATVALARAGADPNDAYAGTTTEQAVGTEADNMILGALKSPPTRRATIAAALRR